MSFRRGLTTTRFSMLADVLEPGDAAPTDIDLDDYGTWVNNQDPLTGEIIRVWIPFPDDPEHENPTITLGTIRCLARGIVDGGIRVAGTTERFGDTYENLEYVKMWVPAKTILTKRHRITNIRNYAGQILWADEEYGGTPKATVFNVNGVTPLFDAFNKQVENFVLLERAEV